jgi:hypothetical protein
MPMGQILPAENKTLDLFGAGVAVKLDRLDVYELESIWSR